MLLTCTGDSEPASGSGLMVKTDGIDAGWGEDGAALGSDLTLVFGTSEDVLLTCTGDSEPASGFGLMVQIGGH